MEIFDVVGLLVEALFTMFWVWLIWRFYLRRVFARADLFQEEAVIKYLASGESKEGGFSLEGPLLEWFHRWSDSFSRMNAKNVFELRAIALEEIFIESQKRGSLKAQLKLLEEENRILLLISLADNAVQGYELSNTPFSWRN